MLIKSKTDQTSISYDCDFFLTILYATCVSLKGDLYFGTDHRDIKIYSEVIVFGITING